MEDKSPAFAEELRALKRQADAATAKKKPKAEIAPVIETENLPVSVVSDMFTDMRLGELFAHKFHGEIRFWPEAGKWLVFDGRRWTTDAPGGAFPFIRRMIEELHQKATACSDYQQRADNRPTGSAAGHSRYYER